MNIDEKKIELFFKEKNIPVCQFCSHNNWGVSPKVFQLHEFDTNGLTIGGPAFPVVPITCNHCGNTLFINAIIAKLIDVTDDVTKE